jgi:hypothetical protein
MNYVPDVKLMISNGMRVVDERRIDLVSEGQKAVETISIAFEESLQRVRDRRNLIPRRLQDDLEHRLHTLGFATRADLRAIEHQLARLVALRAQAGAKPETDPSYREVLRTTISG